MAEAWLPATFVGGPTADEPNAETVLVGHRYAVATGGALAIGHTHCGTHLAPDHGVVSIDRSDVQWCTVCFPLEEKS